MDFYHNSKFTSHSFETKGLNCEMLMTENKKKARIVLEMCSSEGNVFLMKNKNYN